MTDALFERLSAQVEIWRRDNYPCAEYPLLGEILRWQFIGETETDGLRYLRGAQFRALEIYWYLRLKKTTPHIMDLYREYYPNPLSCAKALGFQLSAEDLQKNNTLDGLIANIKNPQWARDKKIDAVHESAILPYPSYILALAMGAGKTVLIGAIIASEFAMSLRYDGDKKRFMQNALVFAPGKTIIESLREIGDMPMAQILPPAVLREYEANVKIVYAADNQKDIPALRGGRHNIIIVNNEKINLRKKSPRTDASQKALIKLERENLTANRRLQTIISLPNLGAFSDEAQNTFGNTADAALKRARATVNYINENTPLVAVVNTTGTPYSKGKTLSEVVCWYGLADGINDGVLKNLDGGVHIYNMSGKNAETETVRLVVKRFFAKYKNTRLQNGAAAKIAFYFKHQEHLDESRPLIEKSLLEIGESAAQILVNTQKSAKEEVEKFNRLNDPQNQHRVILLVQKGVEGWNCPSLFACALIKEQTSDIFVLQASTRCLRQVPGNTQNASVFLSVANKKILERALKKNFGMQVWQLQSKQDEMKTVTVKIRKTNLPPLEITRTISRAERAPKAGKKAITLKKPRAAKTGDKITMGIATPDFESMHILRSTRTQTVAVRDEMLDCLSAAGRIAANYHLPALPILRQLQELYPAGDIPLSDFAALLSQVQKQTADYVEKTEKIKEALALIRTCDRHGNPLFDKNADGCLVHHLRFSDSVFRALTDSGRIASDQGDGLATAESDRRDLSYHYTPYCFDSAPERDFFGRILKLLNEDPDDIRAFVFTGCANDKMTDFCFEYKGEDGRYHRYFPDFVLLKNSGEFYVVEIKGMYDPNLAAKQKAMDLLAGMAENRFRYAVIYADGGEIDDGDEKLGKVIEWVKERKSGGSHAN